MSYLMNRIMLSAIIVSVVAGSVIAVGLSYLVFQPSIDSLQRSDKQLQSTLTSTSTKVTALDSSFADLQKAYISASLIDDRLTRLDAHNIKGTVVNFGNTTATDIVIVAKWYFQGTSFHQETITIDWLAGRSMMELSFGYAFTGAADDFKFTVSWK